MKQVPDVVPAGSPEALKGALLDFAYARDFGIAVAVMHSINASGDTTDVVRVGNIPESFLQTAVDNGNARRDPVLTRLKAGPLPVVYGQDTYVRAGVGDRWEAMAPHGYHSGIAVSLQVDRNRRLMIGIDRPDPMPKDTRHVTRFVADLQLFAVQLQTAASQVLVPKKPVVVELKEIHLAILRLTMNGLSARQVGDALGITGHTVNYHLRGAFDALGVASKSQAVIKATSLGLI